jgi:hypothetical protein
MDRHGLWKNTMVILATDHGHELAEAIRDMSEVSENGRDSTLRIPFGKEHPHYLSHANIPLIIWHPELMNGNKTIDALTCSVDLYATVSEALGGDTSHGPHSRSILPLLAGETRHRDLAYWGTFGQGVCCTDGEYVLLQGFNSLAPLYRYSTVMQWSDPAAESGKFIPGVDCPVWRQRIDHRRDFPSLLIRRDDTLFRERNIIHEEPEVAASLRKRLKRRITEDGCPPEQFDRLGL